MRVLSLLVPDIEHIPAEAGWATFEQTGNALPPATLEAAQAADAIFFGAVASPSYPVPGYRSPIVALRRLLDLYANVRPVRGHSPAPRGPTLERRGSEATHHIDLVVVRENTEDLYIGRERLEDGGSTAIAERVITRHGSKRIVQQAFELARERAATMGKAAATISRLPKVTLVHKANVLRVTDGLFREVAIEVSREYPEIALEELLVDVAAMHLAQSPRRFDVIVTTNMFGDILSDIACIHGGGLGMASSANLGDHQALFEPVHGAAPDIAGRGLANPLAALGCVVMLLAWAERRGLCAGQQSAMLRSVLSATVRHGPHTPDMGGNATTNDVVAATLARLQQRLAGITPADEPDTTMEATQ